MKMDLWHYLVKPALVGFFSGVCALFLLEFLTGLSERKNKLLSKIKRIFQDRFPKALSHKELLKTWRGLNCEGYQKEVTAFDRVNSKSEEFISIIQQSGILKNVHSAHEIGCGPGFNLDLPGVPVLSGNDLDRSEVYQNMPENVMPRIRFYEDDTLQFLRSQVMIDCKVDLLISSDHLMHLSRQIIDEVYELMAKFSRKYIVLREPDGEHIHMQGAAGKRFVWAGDDFENKFKGFTLKHKQLSKLATPSKRFTIFIFERTNETK